jgi:hypothetical protein
MTEAVGIHAHPNLKLGRKQPKRAPSLKAASFLTGAAITHDEAADHFEKVVQWILGHNDEHGTCGPTSSANNYLDVTTYLTDTPINVGDDAVIDLYKRSGNPNFPADDNGVDMQTMFEAQLKGGIGGYKPIAFAQIDHTNLDEILYAIEVFGGVQYGVNLQTAQQQQTQPNGLWDYKRSGEWGGHAIYVGRYSDPDGTLNDRTACITWQMIVDMTDAFEQNQLDEVWVVIWPEHLNTRAFKEGVDFSALKQAYKDLTGKDLPVPDPAPPTPGPEPTPPQPAPSSDLTLDEVSAGLADKLVEMTGEPEVDHRHLKGSLRRVFECGGFSVEIHDER